MKKLHAAMMLGGLLACAGAVSAAEPPATEASASQSRQLAVLIQVDEHGHVSKIRYTEKLPDSIAKLLKDTITQWITKPAVVDGRHVASQLLLTVELRTKPTADGQEEAYFAYVASEAVPNNHDWKLVDGHVVRTGKQPMGGANSTDPLRSGSASAPTRSD